MPTAAAPTVTRKVSSVRMARAKPAPGGADQRAGRDAAAARGASAPIGCSTPSAIGCTVRPGASAGSQKAAMPFLPAARSAVANRR